MNASIDISRVLLASAGRPIPRTYRESLLLLEGLGGIDGRLASALAERTRLRSVLAHRYLEIRIRPIERFLSDGTTDYTQLAHVGAAATEESHEPDPPSPD